MNGPFINGLHLSELFFREAVKPVLEAQFPRLVYSAARIGRGSDVLGFDTPRSMDHDWGPRLQLFVTEEDYEQYHTDIDRVLRECLPYEIHGYPTNFSPLDIDGGWMTPISSGPINHAVAIQTIRSFFFDYLNINPHNGLSVVDWLTCPAQCLRTIRAGKIYYDGLDELVRIQELLHYYPDDIWYYLLAVQWRRISQEEPFVGRCGDVGDEPGSRIIATRLVQELMKLCFLMERQYAPYSKWFGTAFSRLACAPRLLPLFDRILNATVWKVREQALSQAYSRVSGMHNDLKITPPLPTTVSKFYDRPYVIIHAENFVDAIREAIESEEVKVLPSHLGSIDQFVDSVDVLSYKDRCRQLRGMYGKCEG